MFLSLSHRCIRIKQICCNYSDNTPPLRRPRPPKLGGWASVGRNNLLYDVMMWGRAWIPNDLNSLSTFSAGVCQRQGGGDRQTKYILDSDILMTNAPTAVRIRHPCLSVCISRAIADHEFICCVFPNFTCRSKRRDWYQTRASRQFHWS